MKLGRTLGPATGEGNETSHWALDHLGNVPPQRSLRPLIHNEKASKTEKSKRKSFDERVRAQWGDSLPPPAPDADNQAIKDDKDNLNFVPHANYSQYGGDIVAPWAIPEFD